MFTNSAVLDIFWLATYWISFLLTWYLMTASLPNVILVRLIIPLMQGYVDTGEFGIVNKAFDSIKVNLYFYGATSLLMLVLVVYLIFGTHMNTL